MKKGSKFTYVILAICLIFMIGGALNIGFSKFYLAIPFFILSLFISRKNIRLLISIGIFTCFLLTIHFTMFKNPIIFPIINDGIMIRSESGEYKEKYKALKLSNTIEKYLNKGEIEEAYNQNIEIYDILGVVAKGIDEKVISLQTEIGDFDSRWVKYDTDRFSGVYLNKSYHSAWAKYWAYLMYYPLPFFLIYEIYGVIPYIGFIIISISVYIFFKKTRKLNL